MYCFLIINASEKSKKSSLQTNWVEEYKVLEEKLLSCFFYTMKLASLASSLLIIQLEASPVQRMGIAQSRTRTRVDGREKGDFVNEGTTRGEQLYHSIIDTRQGVDTQGDR